MKLLDCNMCLHVFVKVGVSNDVFTTRNLLGVFFFLRSSVEIRKCGIVLEIFNPLIRFYLPLSVMENSTRLDNRVFSKHLPPLSTCF